MSLYLVRGKARYRGYEPGELFIGQLSPEAEERAIARGALELVEREVVTLDPTRVELPRGWVTESSEASG